MKLTALLLCGVFVLPLSADAVTTVKINDTTALFTIPITITTKDTTYHIPIGAQPNLTGAEGLDFVGYTLEADTATPLSITNANAVLLGGQPSLYGTLYALQPNTVTTLTLVALVEFSTPVEAAQYRARLTSFPHYINNSRTGLPKETLSQLTSAALTLKDEN